MGGLTLIALGTGLFRPNILVLIGRLYADSNEKRDERFSLLYMSVNAGAPAGGLLCEWTALQWGWHAGFAAASLGILLCVAALLLLRSRIPRAATYFVYMLSIGVQSSSERRRVLAVLAISPCGAVFMFGFEQAGSWLTLFAQSFTARTVGRFEIPAAWLTGANAVFVVLLAPPLALLWSSRAARDREFTTSQKLRIGLLLTGGGYIVVACAAGVAGPVGRVAPTWLLATYALHTLGELCISPVSMGAITRLAPPRLVSQLMGVWYMSAAFGSVASGALNNLVSFDDASVSSRFVFTAAVISTGGLLLLLGARRLKALSL